MTILAVSFIHKYKHQNLNLKMFWKTQKSRKAVNRDLICRDLKDIQYISFNMEKLHFNNFVFVFHLLTNKRCYGRFITFAKSHGIYEWNLI
jgi:hypothetical protein